MYTVYTDLKGDHMPSKHVRSTDPRKPAIVAALKKLSGGTKVTNLSEYNSTKKNGNHWFHGDCLKLATGGKWTKLGTFGVRADDLVLS
jgi:hypothetical protein